MAAAQEKSDDKTSGKLRKIDDDLAEIKQIRHTAKWLLYVVGVVGAVVLAVVGFTAKEVWGISKPILLEKLNQASPIPTKKP